MKPMILAAWMLAGFGALLFVLALVIGLRRAPGAWWRSLVVSGSALLMFAGAGVCGFVFAPRDAAIEGAVNEFLEAVHRDDAAAMRAAAAEGAVFDPIFLQTTVRPSQEFVPGNSAGGSDDACVRGALVPSRATIVFSLVAVGDRWKVRRVGPSDPECDPRLEP